MTVLRYTLRIPCPHRNLPKEPNPRTYLTLFNVKQFEFPTSRSPNTSLPLPRFTFSPLTPEHPDNVRRKNANPRGTEIITTPQNKIADSFSSHFPRPRQETDGGHQHTPTKHRRQNIDTSAARLPAAATQSNTTIIQNKPTICRRPSYKINRPSSYKINRPSYKINRPIQARPNRIRPSVARLPVAATQSNTTIIQDDRDECHSQWVSGTSLSGSDPRGRDRGATRDGCIFSGVLTCHPRPDNGDGGDDGGTNERINARGEVSEDHLSLRMTAVHSTYETLSCDKILVQLCSPPPSSPPKEDC